jgi:hypothetical protein
VKAGAADSDFFKAPRDCKPARRRRKAMMKGSIKAGDLRQIRPKRPDGPHRQQAARLMQRRQRGQRRKRRDDRIGDFGGVKELTSTVNNVVTDGEQAKANAVRPLQYRTSRT